MNTFSSIRATSHKEQELTRYLLCFWWWLAGLSDGQLQAATSLRVLKCPTELPAPTSCSECSGPSRSGPMIPRLPGPPAERGSEAPGVSNFDGTNCTVPLGVCRVAEPTASAVVRAADTRKVRNPAVPSSSLPKCPRVRLHPHRVQHPWRYADRFRRCSVYKPGKVRLTRD